jgi:riboflavin kinase/FMN adenylyltransferase
MLVIDWLQFTQNGLPLEKKLSSVTVGVFDGVHRGHRALIERVVSYNADYVPAIFTFRENHKTDDSASDIQSFQQKLAMFERLGVKITVVIDFTESFRRIPGIEFLETLFKHGGIGFFAVGNGFRCGFRLDTDAAAIQKYFNSRDIPAEIVPEVIEGNLPISSSRIRKCITGGEIQLAEAMLGRSYNPVEFDNEKTI